MAYNNSCKCNKCKPKNTCGCPIKLDSFCVQYTSETRLSNINVNEGDRLQDILIRINTVIGDLINNTNVNNPSSTFNGKFLYEATGGETVINLTTDVNTTLNLFLVRNGQVDIEGVGNEFTVDNNNNTITLSEPLRAGETIQLFYHTA